MQKLNLRPSNEVMCYDTIGSATAYRLSFARSFVRKVFHEEWSIFQTCFDIDANGVGLAQYEIQTKNEPIFFLIFS